MRELAALAGVGSQTIWRLESGQTREVRVTTVRKLAAALEIDPADLWESARET